jgi:protein ImuB
MQLELATAEGSGAAPRVLALFLPDLPLQRVLRAREAAGAGGRRAPLAVERDGRVVACDAEARARGVAPGQALAQARAACGDLQVTASDEREDQSTLAGLAEALLALAPAVEIASPDALLLDASGAAVLGGGEAALAARAVAAAADLGIRARAAVASGRGPARALARCGPPSAIAPASPAGAAAAMAALPLAALELPPRLAERLAALGLRTAGDLARLPPETLGHRFGPAGLEAWRLAWGDDPSPLAPWVPERLPEERLDLEAPVESAEPLLFALKRLCDRLAARLAGRGLGATRLALALRLDPRGEERVELALAVPSSAASRWLLVLRERLAELRLPGAVAGVAVAIAEAAPATVEQLALGERGEQVAALDAVLARLAARLGDEALCAAEPVERHRPEDAYRAAPFGRRRDAAGEGGRKRRRRGAVRAPEPVDPAADVVACGSPPRISEVAPVQSVSPAEPRGGGPGRGPAPAAARTSAALPDDASPPPSALQRPTRLLPRPLPLVALGEGGRLTAVRAAGRTLRVLALSPAERLAGEWWAEPFDRDYHRARIAGLGDCWIFRDAADGRLWLHGFFD